MTPLPQLPVVPISHIHEHEGQTVMLKGWVYQKTSKGKLHFLRVRDGSGIMQCVVFKGDVSDQEFDEATLLRQESSLCLWGDVRHDTRAPYLPYELSVKGLATIQNPVEDFPISPKEHGTGFLMDNRHLWLRSPRQQAIMRIRHTVAKAIRDFFDGRGFVNVDTPIFTPAACEGTSTLFEVKYFDASAYLTQSGQLYNEVNAAALGKVYCFGPTFRAEKSKTRRHLTEFWMVEPEVAFLDMEGDMELAEDMVVYIVEQVLATRRQELQALERDIEPLTRIKKPFPRLSYDEAHALLARKGASHVDGDDFGAEDETVLGETFDRPVFVHTWPEAIKAFYMKRSPQEPDKVLGFDLIGCEGYGELIGGSVREDDYDLLLGRINANGLNREDFEWYLDLRRFGTFPHAGFGLGLERTVTWICGIHHLRETIAFPRMIDRLKP